MKKFSAIINASWYLTRLVIHILISKCLIAVAVLKIIAQKFYVIKMILKGNVKIQYDKIKKVN